VDAGVAAEKLVTVYNAYDAAFLEPFLSRDDARTACGLDTCRSVVTYAGRVSKEKGVDLILDLARAMPRVMFVLVGSEGHGFIERRAETVENVTIVPWGADRKIAPYLHAADVLIMPPTARPLRRVGNTVLPIKTFQYLAAGRAILAPATPDVAEILIDGRNACLVPPDDVKAAKTRLEDLLADEPARSSLAREAAATARRHTWPQRAGDVLEFLTERLDRSESARG
jgi:glycosyltransferase involved in cell wall biosynthesis